MLHVRAAEPADCAVIFELIGELADYEHLRHEMVGSVEQLRSLVHNHDSQVALLIQRGDTRIFIPVELG